MNCKLAYNMIQWLKKFENQVKWHAGISSQVAIGVL